MSIYLLLCLFGWGLATANAEGQPGEPTSNRTPASEGRIISEDSTPGAASSRSSATVLTRDAASIRSRQVHHISYNLWFSLDGEENLLQGKTQVQFDLKPKAKDHSKTVLLDLEGGTLSSLTINGKAIEDLKSEDRFDGHHITLKVNELQPTGNRIEIKYSHPYGNTGYGLHRFKDPEDGAVYLYTDFEPYDAHRLFPCFDQPDLKATYELSVEVPKNWEVISNTLPKTPATGELRKTWNFPVSPVFSTYVFALHAGPYSVWKSNSNGIPLRLFSRKSLAKYVDHDEWFKITQKGLDYFSNYFGFPYPFGKYDQIIVPDFNAGAMENVGAVTFSEKHIYRTHVTADRKRRRAETILHEMAHMWFGNLVTMKWWNGLWLNESFASFMAASAVEQTTNYKGSWQSFFSDEKQRAYWEDQLVTTHAVELSVPDTEQAEANFDGITYGKGAATLKQLSFFLGDDDFREGLQRYFQKYAFKNTTIGEFMRMLSEASSEDLSKWQKSWLLTPGLNSVKAEWECEIHPESGRYRILKMKLLQSGSPEETRVHRTQVGLFNFAKGHDKNRAPLVLEKALSVTYTNKETPVLEAMGKACPDFVFPNYQDYDYVKVDLDAQSLKTVTQHLGQIQDAFTRQMVWHTLWEMVIDGKLKAQDYADIVLKQGGLEKDTQVLSKILRNLADSSGHRSSVLKFLTGEIRSRYQALMETFIRSHLQGASAGSDLQIVWFQAFIEIAASPRSTQFLMSLLKGEQKLKGFKIDQEHRWDILEALAKAGLPGALEMIHAEVKKDPTDMGERSAISAEVMIPDPQNKAQWLNRITRNVDSSAEGTSLSPAKLKEAMGSFNILGQDEAIQKSTDAYFQFLEKLSSSHTVEDGEYLKWFSKLMYPAHCDPTLVKKTSEFLGAHSGLPASVVKNLKIGRQEEERCILARSKSMEAS